MKALSKILILVFVSLTIVIQVGAQETTSVHKGDKVPFTGKLMLDSVFARLNADLDAGDTLTSELILCRDEKAQCVTAQESDSTKWFAAGGLTGVVFTVIIYNLANKK